jgi:hypothetical protein
LAYDPQLGGWVTLQRQLRRQGRLSPERIQRLDHLGFEWTPQATAWDEMFATLVQFKDRAGDCDVPFGWSEDLRLLRWVDVQRHLRRQGLLTTDRIERLDALGFKWDESKAKRKLTLRETRMGCAAAKRDGSLCAVRALPGSLYCIHHQARGGASDEPKS